MLALQDPGLSPYAACKPAIMCRSIHTRAIYSSEKPQATISRTQNRRSRCRDGYSMYSIRRVARIMPACTRRVYIYIYIYILFIHINIYTCHGLFDELASRAKCATARRSILCNGGTRYCRDKVQSGVKRAFLHGSPRPGLSYSEAGR